MVLRSKDWEGEYDETWRLGKPNKERKAEDMEVIPVSLTT